MQIQQHLVKQPQDTGQVKADEMRPDTGYGLVDGTGDTATESR